MLGLRRRIELPHAAGAGDERQEAQRYAPDVYQEFINNVFQDTEEAAELDTENFDEFVNGAAGRLTVARLNTVLEAMGKSTRTTRVKGEKVRQIFEAWTEQ